VKKEGRKKKALFSLFPFPFSLFSLPFSLFPLLFSLFPLSSSFAQSGVNIETNTAWLWRQAVGGAVIGQPTVQAQSVVVALDGGTVKAYSASGRPLWTFSARGRISPQITRSREGTSYICRTNGILIALSRIGKELWQANVGGALSGPVVVGWDGRVFVPTARKIFCYTASGNLLWVRDLEAAISAGPWLDQNGGILLALENGSALRINHFGVAAVMKLSPGVRILLSSGSSIIALYRSGDIQVIDPFLSNAAPVSAPSLPSPPLAAANKGNTVVAVLANGQVVMLSPNGEIRWTADTHIKQENNAAVIYDERGIFVLSSSGASGYNIDGKRLWFTTLRNASGIPAFDDNGVLYSGGTDWILYAWKLEERVVRQRLTLYGPAPQGSYRKGMSLPSAFTGSYDEADVKNKLDDIQREILAGRVGENEQEWISYLVSIAQSGERQGIYSISLRVYALQLLSRIGSGELLSWLARYFRTEEEPLVKAAIAYAIGGIGLDPNGTAIRTLLAVALEGNMHDDRVLSAIAVAAGALCRFSGPPLFDIGARILVLLSSNPPQSVQWQARHELERLME
jgi:outer membrane protein assembly factor BamB